MEKVSTEIRETWARANEEITGDLKVGRYFMPLEGNAEVNQRLAKGFELADRAFSENPMDPSLTAEQRQSVIKRHAAIRNRAAAFGRLVYENNQAQTTISELKAEIARLKSGEPELAGHKEPSTPAARKTTMSSVLENLRSRAKPA
jgi:hypothetical protein